MDKAITSGLIVGSVGDSLLQTFLNIGILDDKNIGLKKYFSQHGKLESVFIAGGMIASFSAAYSLVDPSMNLVGLSIYGTGLDILFRQTHKEIFPSLEEYYKKMSLVNSALWGAIPMACVGIFYHII
jgi:hypothetical protein